MFKDFKEFIMRGNVIDMAVGIVIGAAFGVIIKSLVEDVIMPPIGLLLGNVDFTNLFLTLKEGPVAGHYASLVIRNINKLRREKEVPSAAPMTKECPYCLSAVPIKATRCAYCTSELK